MSHSASDGIGNRLYLLIPAALSFSLSLRLALSFHSSLIHLLRSLLNISPKPIFLPLIAVVFSDVTGVFLLRYFTSACFPGQL